MQQARHPISSWTSATILALLLLITGCAGHNLSTASYAPTHYYPPPGPRDDPWGPYITQAAARFQIPGQWIRAVMQQESGGEEQAVSPVGAMGLMQLMPETYQGLESQYGLGEDPFNPENNILAGAAYISQMYQRYGAPGFLAAYNAGPEDVDEYLAGNGPLPDETVNYLAMVTPNLGAQIAFSGPFANYEASGAGQSTPTSTDFASGCDMNAAYDPAHPCAAPPPSSVIHGQPVIVASSSAGSCNADSAYDPNNPCTPSQSPPPPLDQTAETIQSPPQPNCGSSAVFDPACPASVIASVDSARPPAQVPQPAYYQPPTHKNSENWGIQVGAFSNAALAQNVAQNAQNEASDILASAEISVPSTTPFGGNILYEARLINLSAAAAVQACSALNHRQLPCVVVRPASA